MSKIAYFDGFSGISGDMIIASLLDAGANFHELKIQLDKLHLPDCELRAEKVVKKGIAATKFDVLGGEEQVYRHLKDLNRIVDNSELDGEIQARAKTIFMKIANAEAKVHNQPIEKVHFHEIGAVDTIVDVVGALVGIKLLGIEKVFCSPLNGGSGFVEFSHGRFAVPAPATAELLKGVPIYATDSNAELVTPTGAAIITTIADGFGPLPAMKIEHIGYGAGTHDLSQPNLLRLFVGSAAAEGGVEHGVVSIIETNIDDMNPQFYEHVLDKLLERGALEVYLTNVMMKKNRPAVKLTVLSRVGEEKEFVRILFEETTTLGMRIRHEQREILPREIKPIATKFGTIRVKISPGPDGVVTKTPEFADCKKIADQFNIPLKQVYREIGEQLKSV
jgi:uncharacterized protein (TIGR00299 family) protein